MNGDGGYDWSGGEFGGGSGGDIYTPVGDTTVDPGFYGGPDINLSSLGNLIPGGGMMQTGAAQAMGAVGMAGGLAVRMSSIVAGAILKLKQTLGGGGFLTAGGIASFGRKTWSVLSSWAARNPSVSIISTLVGLGLTVEEAAHFISWGVTHKRKRRARGISGADLKRTGRTIRTLTRYHHMLRSFCGGVGGGYRRHSFRRAAASRR